MAQDTGLSKQGGAEMTNSSFDPPPLLALFFLLAQTAPTKSGAGPQLRISEQPAGRKGGVFLEPLPCPRSILKASEDHRMGKRGTRARFLTNLTDKLDIWRGSVERFGKDIEIKRLHDVPRKGKRNRCQLTGGPVLTGLDLKVLKQESNILRFREVIFKSAESELEQQEAHGMLEKKRDKINLFSAEDPAESLMLYKTHLTVCAAPGSRT